jgi:hypothetical protein
MIQYLEKSSGLHGDFYSLLQKYPLIIDGRIKTGKVILVHEKVPKTFKPSILALKNYKDTDKALVCNGMYPIFSLILRIRNDGIIGQVYIVDANSIGIGTRFAR